MKNDVKQRSLGVPVISQLRRWSEPFSGTLKLRYFHPVLSLSKLEPWQEFHISAAVLDRRQRE